jgi:uncharacterized protein YfbU (UPF0304 family)
MQAMTERFEMRLGQAALEKVDAWRASQDDLPSRAEAVRRLVEVGMSATGRDRQIRFGDGEKLILLMLCELYRHLKIEGDIDPKFVKAAIHGGHHWALKWQYPGIFHDHEDNERVVSEVTDVLEMWSYMEAAFGKLSKKDKDRVAAEADPFGKQVIFPGFDGNNESQYLSVARFLINELDRFSEFKGRDLNSQMPSIDAYRRMLSVFEPIQPKLVGRALTAAEIIDVLKAKTHPPNRKS